jgi:hypothetical protein
VGVGGDEGKKLGEWGGALAEGEVVPFFGGVVVEVGADDAWGEAAEVLGVIEKAEPMFGGGMTKIVPVAEGGRGEAGEESIPEVVGGDFARIFAAFEAEAEAEGGGFLAKAEENFFDAGPGFVKGFFERADGGYFFANVRAGSELAGEGKGFEGIDEVPWTGGSEVEDDESGADAGGGFESGEGVAFGEAPSGGSGIGKLVGVGVRAQKFDWDGAKVVQDIDTG